MDLTAATDELTSATGDAARLLPARAHDPVLSGVLLVADAVGVTVAATDAERTVALRRPAHVHTDGTVLVPGKPLAETLRALDVPEVRLVVEGARLAVRTPHARFALPILDVDRHPGVPSAPARAGQAGRTFARALLAVAGAASKDDALPLFSGVRVRGIGDTLRLVATDRYRLAVAQLPWRPAAEHSGLDVLIPATFAAEIARRAIGVPGELTLHADADRAAISWPNTSIGTALLATPFPDENRHIGTTGDASLDVIADELLAAVRRVGRYADGRGAIALELGDGEVRVLGGGADLGEADESVKATVTGRLRQAYRARYLVDALRAFAGQTIMVDIKSGLRSTVLRPTDPDELDLHYVVMPILPG